MIKKPKKFFMKKKEEKKIEEVSLVKVVRKPKIVTKGEVVVIKRKKEQKLNAESPKIPRFIPEFKLSFLHISGGILGVILLVALGVWLFLNLLQFQQLQAKRNALQKGKATWQKIAKQYPGYRDAYFQLALISYQLRDFQNAEQYIEKVIQLDPSFTPARELESEIRIQGNKEL